MKTVTLLAALLVLVPSGGATAQSPWLGGEARNSLALEAIRPSLEGDDLSASTGVLVLSGRFRIAPSARLVFEAPFAHASVDGLDGSSTTLGNPYLGAELGRLDGNAWVELGVRPPLLGELNEDNFASAIGLLGDLDRMEAFVNEATSLSAFGNLRTLPRNGFQLHLRGGPVYTSSELYEDGSEFLLGYGGHAIRHLGTGRVGAGVTGRWWVTEDGTEGDTTLHQLGLFGEVKVGTVHPGLYVRIPLDEEMREVMDYVIGFQLQVDLR